jgi:hypothetical protein
VAEGTVAAGALFVAIGFSTGPIGWAVIGGSLAVAAGAGVLIGMGAGQIKHGKEQAKSGAGTSIPSNPDGTLTEANFRIPAPKSLSGRPFSAKVV